MSGHWSFGLIALVLKQFKPISVHNLIGATRLDSFLKKRATTCLQEVLGSFGSFFVLSLYSANSAFSPSAFKWGHLQPKVMPFFSVDITVDSKKSPTTYRTLKDILFF